MRAVIQRASGATVSVDGKEISGFTGAGLVVLLHTDGDGQKRSRFYCT